MNEQNQNNNINSNPSIVGMNFVTGDNSVPKNPSQEPTQLANPIPISGENTINNMVDNNSTKMTRNEAQTVSYLNHPNTTEPIPPLQSNQELPQESMDNSFLEQKKKSPVGIIILILLLLLLGLSSVYYFIIDNPKIIFVNAASKVFSKTTNLTEKSIDYNLAIKGASSNDNYNQIINIINQMTFAGTIGSISDSKILSGNINYKEEKLLDYNFQIDSGEKPTIYAKLNDLYEKVIKLDLTKETKNNYDTNTKDYEQVVSSLSDTISSSLTNAKYQKEITKLDNTTVKKVTLQIDESLLTSIYNKLLQDNNFLVSYARVNNITIDQVSNELNKAITDAKDNDESISLYVTPLKNEFLKFEYIGGENSLIVNKNNDRYDFDIIESYTSKYQGYIKVNENNNKTNLILSLSLIKEQINFEINTTYSIIKNEELKLLDMSNVVNYDDITDEEIETIMTKLQANSTITNLIKDLGLLPEDSNLNTNI